MAEADGIGFTVSRKDWQCVDCGVAVAARSVRCRSCNGVAWSARRLAVSKNTFHCEHCGIAAHRNRSKQFITSGGGNRWCSMACKKAQSAKVRAEIAALKRMRAHNKVRPGRADWSIAYKTINAHVWKPRPCSVCGGAFVKAYGQKGFRSYCSEACKTEAARSVNRTGKSARRAKVRGAEADNIDPLRVFERDGWRCHLCRRATPKRLRGTYEPRAPELDHVLPLSIGGAHTWGNVACACRACNQSKGARPLGQLGLGIAA
jgi:5-methylcytosine-specific restriction endonuclease McrA